MTHVTHEYPRAHKAATEVDSMILAQALDHIARTAARSRSQTRRIRWIERRAQDALAGKEFFESAIDLPKSAGPDTHEKLQRRMAYHIAIQHQLREALQALHANLLAQELENEAERPTEEEFQQCMRNAAAALANMEGVSS